MDVHAVLSFNTADFTHELKSATKVKKTPSKRRKLMRRGVVPTLVTEYGCGKITLNFGENILVGSNICRAMYIENPGQKEKVVSFITEPRRSSSELQVSPSHISVAPKSKSTVYVNFMPTASSKDKYFGKISFKISGMKLPLEVKAVATVKCSTKPKPLKQRKVLGGSNIKTNPQQLQMVSKIQLKTTKQNQKRQINNLKPNNNINKYRDSDHKRYDGKEEPRVKKYDDEKLRKILKGPVGIPKRKSMPLTQPKSFILGGKNKLKYVNELTDKSKECKTNFLSGNNSHDISNTNNIISSDWKNELKKLGQSKYNGEASHKHNNTFEEIEMHNVMVQSTRTKQANLTSTKLKAENNKTKTHSMTYAPKRLGNARREPIAKKKSTMAKKNAHIAKNICVRRVLYDENWAEKQIYGFTVWLNHTFYPAEYDMYAENDNIDNNSQEARIVNNNTTNDKNNSSSNNVLSAPGGGAPAVAEDHFKVLLQKRRQAKVRHRAFRMFHSQEIDNICYVLDKEVASEKLKVRTDRELYADLGLRSEIIGMIMSYNPVWLRLGLETTYGEVIPMPKRAIQDAGRSVLKQFVKNRVLQDPATSDSFKTTKQGVFGKGYVGALARVTLRRFLMLVLFLDKAKQSNILGNGPCLFNQNSKIKSSRDMLITFAKQFLSGEGDIIRHLSLMGYTVDYKQELLDEFDYTVKNLASDLRDGVRLCRLVELLQSTRRERPLSKKLRMPAGSLLQKKHNVKLALCKLKKSSISLKTKAGRSFRDIGADDIVQAHKENTLTLLWRIILTLKLQKMLPESILNEEINIVKAEMSDTALKFIHDQENLDKSMKNNDTNVSALPPFALLLKGWVRCICARELIPVYDFSSSFADGRILCTLVNYYHPELLPKESIHDKTLSNLMGKKQTYSSRLNDNRWCDEEHNSNVELSEDEFSNILLNETKNFNTFNEAIKSLGSVPATLNTDYNSEYVPEEKSVLVCIGYLCARLLESSKETHAAIKLQTFWRVIYRKKMLLKHRASGIIVKNALVGNLVKRRKMKFKRSIILLQSHTRGFKLRRHFKRLKRTCLTVQTFYRMKFHQRQFRVLLKAHKKNIKAIVTFQAVFRKTIDQRKFRSLKQKVIKLQQWRRVCLLAKQFNKIKHAIVMIQKTFRTFIESNKFKLKLQSIVCMQSFVRSYQAKQLKQTLFSQMELKKYTAASTIQTFARMYQSYKTFTTLKLRTIQLQSIVRMYVASKQYNKMRKSVVCMQSFVRSYQAKQLKQTLFSQMELKKYTAASTIQTFARMYQSYKTFTTLKLRTIQLQSIVRMYVASKQYNKMRKSVVCMQSFVRLIVATKRYNAQKLSTIKIQSFFRKSKHQFKFKQIMENAIKLQRSIRVFIARKKLKALLMKKQVYKLKSTITLQCIFRGYIARKNMLCQRLAGIKIQTFTRRAFVLRRFKAYKAASIKIQSILRMFTNYISYRKKKTVVVAIQNRFRKYVVLQRFKRLKRASLHVQTFYRANKAYQAYRVSKQHIIKLQSFVRQLIHARRFMKMKSSAIFIQRWFCSILMKKSILMQENLAIICQKLYRGNCDRKKYKLLKTYKRYEAEVYIKRVNAANVIRALYKRYKVFKSVKILQQFTQIIIAKRHVRFKKQCVVKLQSVVRGIIARRRSSKLLIEARIRVQKAIELGREEEKLGNRTDVALNILLTSNNLSGVKRAAVTLEVSTKMSHVCAKRFVEKGAVAIIYRLIRSCNRSEPHRAVLSHALNVLRQVSSYEILLDIFSPSREYRIETLVELLQTFRDQPIRLRQILFLIADVCKDEAFIANLSKNKDLMKRLNGILRLLKRKTKSENKENAFGNRRSGNGFKTIKKRQALLQRNIVNLELLLDKINRS
eukprot:g6218.t1